MKPSIGPTVLSLVLLSPMAHADPEGEPAPIAQSLRDAPRLRLGLACNLLAAFGEGQGTLREQTFGTGGGADVGVQWGDTYALYARGQLAISLAHAAAYGVAEWSPVRWFSLGTGIGVDWIQNDPSYPSLGTPGATWTGASIPVIVGFNVGSRPAWLARRSVFRVEFEVATGIDERLAPGYHGGIALGWTRM